MKNQLLGKPYITQILNVIKKNIGIILLISASLIGLFNYGNYGLCWDEEDARKIGIVSYDYVFSGNKALLTYGCRTYGVAIELPLVMIEKAFGLHDIRDIYLARHLLIHLFFLTSAFFCFLLVDFLYGNKLLASIGFLLVVLSPIFYAHSFFNSKDISSAALFMICFYLNAVAFNKQKIKHFILLGVGIGLLINIRIMGVLLFGCILGFLLLDFFMAIIQKTDYKKTIKLVLAFLLATILSLYISWPYLWENPISNFVFAFKNMTKFPWEGTVLFNGNFIRSAQLPWYYVPVWIAITTPIYYLIAGFGAVILLFIKFSKKPFDFLSNTIIRNNLFYIVCFFAPISAVIILKSTLYDGWRHLFFIYPSFALLSIFGINFLLQTKFKNFIIIITFVYFSFVGWFMIKNNPFQQVYFNELFFNKPPEYIRTHFEFDYWGASYKQSLEYILKEDNISPSINVLVWNPPGRINVNMLTKENRKRINIVETFQEAKYFITNYRWHPEDYTELEKQKWHVFKVNNNTISEIFKIK
jgi:hypothetical protein